MLLAQTSANGCATGIAGHLDNCEHSFASVFSRHFDATCILTISDTDNLHACASVETQESVSTHMREGERLEAVIEQLAGELQTLEEEKVVGEFLDAAKEEEVCGESRANSPHAGTQT